MIYTNPRGLPAQYHWWCTRWPHALLYVPVDVLHIMPTFSACSLPDSQSYRQPVRSTSCRIRLSRHHPLQMRILHSVTHTHIYDFQVACLILTSIMQFWVRIPSLLHISIGPRSEVYGSTIISELFIPDSPITSRYISIRHTFPNAKYVYIHNANVSVEFTTNG